MNESEAWNDLRGTFSGTSGDRTEKGLRLGESQRPPAILGPVAPVFISNDSTISILARALVIPWSHLCLLKICHGENKVL